MAHLAQLGRRLRQLVRRFTSVDDIPRGPVRWIVRDDGSMAPVHADGTEAELMPSGEVIRSREQHPMRWLKR
jgi:hypothetical protein